MEEWGWRGGEWYADELGRFEWIRERMQNCMRRGVDEEIRGWAGRCRLVSANGIREGSHLMEG